MVQKAQLDPNELTNLFIHHAMSLAIFKFLKSVCVSEASSIDELSACVSVSVVVPHRVVSSAGSVNLGQVANFLSNWLNASFLAITFGVESVFVASTSAIPEATAAAILSVEEVFDGVVVAACSHVTCEAASFLW